MAILLLTLLTAAAFAAIRTSTRAVTSGEAQIDRTNQLRVAQDLLRRQITQVMAMPFKKESGTGRPILFLGDRQTMTYVAPMPGYLGRGGPYVQRIALEQTENGLALMFYHTLLNGFDEDEKFPEKPGPVILLSGIVQGYFEYRGLDDMGKLDRWADEWNKAGPNPLLVKLHLEFARESPMRWPELIIPLKVDPTAVSFLNEPSFFQPPGG